MTTKILLVSFFTIIFNIAFGQSWAPFHSGDTSNFEPDTSNQIKYTVWVDSMTVSGTDTLYHFNRIAKDCIGCSYALIVANQPQFLGFTMQPDSNGRFDFEGSSNFTLMALADSGDSWVWDATNSILASVTEIKIDTLWGQIDSIKTISLSNGDEVVLSREHGVLTFPEEFGGTTSVSLAGIQNRGIGKKVPGFWEIYDFQIGDIFYHLYSGGALGFGIEETYLKRTIIDKNITNDTLTYTVYTKGLYGYSWDWPCCKSFHDYEYQEDWVFVNYPEVEVLWKEEGFFGAENGFNNQLIPFQLSNETYYFKLEVKGNQKVWRHIYEPISPNSDTMRISAIAGILQIKQELEAGLGETYFRGSYFESAETHELLGYIRNGDSVGTIIPDSQLIAHIEKPIESGSIQVFPNPAIDFLQIQVENYQYLPANLRIRDLQGREVFSSTIEQSQERISLPKLPKSWYLVEIIEKSGKVLRDKILIMNH